MTIETGPVEHEPAAHPAVYRVLIALCGTAAIAAATALLLPH